MNQKVKDVFSSQPMVSFRTARELSNCYRVTLSFEQKGGFIQMSLQPLPNLSQYNRN